MMIYFIKQCTAMTSEQLEQLLARCALGDDSAFQLLYNSVVNKLNGIAFRIVNNVDTASEVLQEAFLQIWSKAGEYRAETAEPMVWMAAIVRYRAYDRIRHDNRRVEGYQLPDSQEELETYSNNTLSPSLVCELNQQLDTCLKLLDNSQQHCILMAYYYGFSREEISEHFGAPINTVKSWLRRGIARLQPELEHGSFT